ncbi:hypothetical protein [Enterovibrio norvegicus]|uniref:hypothetical protein n=1 Tax=Enterovibrio norvegicus TaxID=188144 RepID=UPI000C816B52|nr:hypothetical protein [Enterovibrio norvegicus]PMH64528.1 hypothetical protein BCU62_15855 [Enterovibrio norvegicus]
MTDSIMTFAQFKDKCSLYLQDEDHFTDYHIFGGTESNFETWLNKQRLVLAEFGKHRFLADMELPEKRWMFFETHYVRQIEEEYLINNYPKGYFEAIRKKCNTVACFLPDTYGKFPYRITFAGSNGPIYHEVFSTRNEALLYLARRDYTASPGALDALTNFESWDRGVMVCRWLSQGISVIDGVTRDQNDPEVGTLFADLILQINSKKSKDAA